MSVQSQISATISAGTKERLDRFTESHGLRKNYVVEQALLFFMEARTELPDEALVPARFVLEDEGFDRLLLRHVLGLALEQRDRVGCVGVVADARPGAVAFHESLGFSAVQGVREGLLHGEPVPMFLATGTVRVAKAG